MVLVTNFQVPDLVKTGVTTDSSLKEWHNSSEEKLFVPFLFNVVRT